MNIYKFTVVIVFVIGCLTLVSCRDIYGAQNTPDGSQPSVIEGKIGFVDSSQVLYGTEEGRQQISKIQGFIDQHQRQFESQRTELDQLREEFQEKQLSLNAQARVAMQRQIEGGDRRLKRFQEDTRMQVEQRRQELLGRVGEKVQRIINEYTAKNGFTAIFLRSESQLYVDPDLDLTKDIIQIYNETHGVPIASKESAKP